MSSPTHSIRIVVDTSSNVPEAFLEQFGMIEVATSVFFGDEEFRLKRDIDLPRFYHELATRAEHPTTSQPTPLQFSEAYEQARAEGAAHILCIVVSSKLSGTYNSAVLGARGFPEDSLTVWDSRGVSIMSGLQAIAAARWAGQGRSLPDIVAGLTRIRDIMVGFLTVENLDALARSGRVSALQKSMGNMLNLKPILAVEGGEVLPVAKVRGRSKAKADILRRVEAVLGTEPAVLVVSHANVPDEAETYLASVAPRFNVAESHLVELDPAIAALAGAGTLGLAGYTVEPEPA